MQTEKRQRIGIIGGTFDPIHYGHLVIAEEARATLQLSKMIFIPAGQPPHKPGRVITSAEHRLKMVQLAVASNPDFIYSRIEIDRTGPSYTVETLRLLRQQWGSETDIYILIGWDSLEELHSWYNAQGILAQVTQLVAVGRPGYMEECEYNKQQLEAHVQRLEERLPGLGKRLIVIPTPQLEISSTDLRQRVAAGRPVKYQVPEAIEEYIRQHELYK